MAQKQTFSKMDEHSKKAVSINLQQKWINSILRSVGMYPLTMIRTLIQLGYEPLPPTFGKSFSGSPRLYLPNVLTYGSYVRDVDGFFGVYRGFSPYVAYELTKICAEFFVDKAYDDYLTEYIGEDNKPIIDHNSNIDVEDNKNCQQKSGLLSSLDSETINELKKSQKELIISLISTAVSHPLRVVATRTIAEFIGHENLYTNVSKSFSEIWTHEGISGFFMGLYSALLGCAWFVTGSTLLYLSSLYILKKYATNYSEQHSVKTFLKFGCAVISSYQYYPYQTVTTAMMVNGSRLRIAQADNGYPFKSCYDCYVHLKKNGRLYRGSSLFFRKQL